jgi:hypothetical protein
MELNYICVKIPVQMLKQLIVEKPVSAASTNAMKNPEPVEHPVRCN